MSTQGVGEMEGRSSPRPGPCPNPYTSPPPPAPWVQGTPRPTSAPRPTTPAPRCPHAPFTAPTPCRVSTASSASGMPHPPAIASPGSGQRERDRTRSRRCSWAGELSAGAPGAGGQGPPQVPSHSEGALPLTRLFPGRAAAPSTPQSRQTDRRSGRAPQGRTVELGPRTPPERALGRGQVGAAEAGEPQCRRGPAAPSPGSLPQRGPSVSGSPAGPGSAW